MKFCPLCRNMLYGIDEDKVDDVNTAVLTCRKCEYKEALSSDNPVVYEHVLKQHASQTLAMNPYLKYDPTLEHLTNIVCPNKECPSIIEKKTPDVVPVELDHANLLWMYQCAHCNTTWTQTSRAT